MKRLVFVAALALAGCATGSHVLVGNARQATTAEAVKLYTAPPADYEVIALVRGHSVMGWTQQQDTDAAVLRLKEEAAKLGANGVLIGRLDEGGNFVAGTAFTSSGEFASFSSGVSNQAAISGQAIWVP